MRIAYYCGMETTISLNADEIHAVLTSLAFAERMYNKTGFTGFADNAKNAYLAIQSQLKNK
jgi:hypothetical protein